MDPLKYPIGPFSLEEMTRTRAERIEDIRNFPEKIKTLLETLPAEGITYTYRPGGWNIQQLIHHCADSHMNAVIRFKLALTEDQPTILPYKQAEWAELYDTKTVNLWWSVQLLEGLHKRWAALLENMTEEEFARTYIHPEHKHSIFSLDEATAQYSWHCRHHLAHLQNAISRNS